MRNTLYDCEGAQRAEILIEILNSAFLYFNPKEKMWKPFKAPSTAII